MFLIEENSCCYFMWIFVTKYDNKIKFLQVFLQKIKVPSIFGLFQLVSDLIQELVIVNLSSKDVEYFYLLIDQILCYVQDFFKGDFRKINKFQKNSAKIF
eukprot:TRINITY_DN8065_c0_g2_i10.p4 TRINITY_DN8065_c0_g2~~TRINITY_DN8065_c0_g2_i10.p4  ORF type:complete len:100 (-),score=1.56 TRINITY_DN8065_c0_g2_i10:402-701(-)